MTKKSVKILEWKKFNREHRLYEVTKSTEAESSELVAYLLDRKTRDGSKQYQLYSYIEGFRNEKKECTLEEARRFAEDFHRLHYS